MSVINSKKAIAGIGAICVSSLFIFHGLRLLTFGDLPLEILFFAIITGSYGAISIALVIASWNKPKKVWSQFAKYLSIGFFTFELIASSDTGIQIGQKYLALFLLAGLLFIVYWGISTLSEVYA